MKVINKLYNFHQFEAIRYFPKNILDGQISLNDADKDHRDLLTEFVDVNKETKPRHIRKNKKEIFMKA